MKELVLSRLGTLLGIVFTYTLTMIVYFGSTCEAVESFKTRLKLKSKYYDSYVKTGSF